MTEDRAFWENPFGERREAIRRVREEEALGVFIDAPERVPLDTRATFPLVLLHAVRRKDARKIILENAAVAVAVRLETGHVEAAMALDRFLLEENPPDVEEAAPESMVEYAMHLADLRAKLEIPWQRGKYLVTVVSRDVVSNRVVSELGPSSLAYADPAVDALIAERLAALPDVPVWHAPGRPFPTYVPIAAAPPIPEAPGIALTASRVMILRPGAELVVAGSFRLPLSPREQRSGAAAITLVATGSVTAEPVVLHVGAPVREGPGAAEGTGHFAVDLAELPALDRARQTYFVYAFAHTFMAGPANAALVDEAELPSGRWTL